MTPELAELIERARLHKSTDAEMRAAAISFAFGNCAIENPLVTREMVEQEYDKLPALPLARALYRANNVPLDAESDLERDRRLR